jgi:hypothetical protein
MGLHVASLDGPDIFEFWSGMKRGLRIHPADELTFRRMDAERHGFDLNCLPGCFAGRLRTASVVLLYLSPGHDESDVADAETDDARDYRLRSYDGNEPFRDRGKGREWLESRTKVFCDYQTVKRHFAVLNIGAYHSKSVKSFASLLALPSSRVSLSWAQETLFTEAEAGKRVVICMRSATYWGLDTGRRYKGTLFAPHVNRGGHLLKTKENQRLIEIVRKRLGQMSSIAAQA